LVPMIKDQKNSNFKLKKIF